MFLLNNNNNNKSFNRSFQAQVMCHMSPKVLLYGMQKIGLTRFLFSGSWTWVDEAQLRTRAKGEPACSFVIAEAQDVVAARLICLKYSCPLCTNTCSTEDEQKQSGQGAYPREESSTGSPGPWCLGDRFRAVHCAAWAEILQAIWAALTGPSYLAALSSLINLRPCSEDFWLLWSHC